MANCYIVHYTSYSQLRTKDSGYDIYFPQNSIVSMLYWLTIVCSAIACSITMVTIIITILDHPLKLNHSLYISSKFSFAGGGLGTAHALTGILQSFVNILL